MAPDPDRPGPTRSIDRLRRIARLFDEAVGVPGTRLRVGLDALLGLIPGAGDAAGAVVTAYVVLAAAKLGAPASVIGRMLLNLLVDAATGVVPVLGDLFDVGWKANTRNVQLLERYVERPAQVRTSSRLVVGGVLLVLALLLAGGVYALYGALRWLLAVCCRP